jgi:tetratricopeptide (TPR) repeat protein
LGEQDWLMRSHVRWNLAVADWLRGRLGPAGRGLAEVTAERRAAGEGYLAMEVCYDLGQVQRALGNLDAALATYRQALETAGEGNSQPPHLGMAHVGLAEVLYERDELAAALDHAIRGVTLCRQLAFTQPLATGLAVLARIWQAHGDAVRALEAMGEAGQVELSPQVIALLNPVPSQRARLLLAQGDLAAATRWTTERGLGPDDEPPYPREPEYLVLARVLLAQDRPGTALALLEWLLAVAVSQGRTGSVIEIRALRALALAASGRAEPADSRGPGGHPRHGQETRQPPAGQAGGGQPHRGRHPRPPARPDPLTARHPAARSPGGTPALSCPGPAAEDSTRIGTFG